MRRFLCWLRFGHIWKEVGPMGPFGKSTMYQCQHCFLTEIFHNATGNVKRD